jgi:hypothetical protein
MVASGGSSFLLSQAIRLGAEMMLRQDFEAKGSREMEMRLTASWDAFSLDQYVASLDGF